MGDIASVKFLLSQDIDINITNDSKVSALSIACETNNFDMVRFLLNKNIEFDTTNIIGIKPIQTP
jgi:ankyrin repeat protein